MRAAEVIFEPERKEVTLELTLSIALEDNECLSMPLVIVSI